MIKAFFARQLYQIRIEGSSAIRRKFARLVGRIFEFFLMLIILPLVLFVRLIKPIAWIRFGPIRSDVVGHFISDTEYYLSWREVESLEYVDFFFYSTSSLPNEQWALMVERCFNVHPIFRYFYRVNQILPNWEDHLALTLPKGQASLDPPGMLNRTKTHINFTEDEDRRGRDVLIEMGLEPESPFVCLIVRDGAYKSSRFSQQQDWSHHAYRDTDIDSYEMVALDLAAKGFWVFRMGKVVEKPFRVGHPHIIDYANTDYRNDFLDIWLMAHCHLTITTGTGLDEVPVAFRHAYVVVNLLPVGGIRSSKFSVVLFKKLKSKSSGEMLGLREQIHTGLINCFHMQQYQDMDVDIIDNTPEEITEAVCELECRLDGTWSAMEGDGELQERFWNIINEWDGFSGYNYEARALICTSFLRKNHEWFLA
jgi:putative glycosyltransferase (TIGR04372 family)